MSNFTLADLERIVAQRALASPSESWTAKLLAAGPEKAAKKLAEEAIELALATVSEEDAAVVAESADLLYHLMVVLASRGLALDDVMGELQRRTSQSGLAEKASRPSS
ncbi:MAG: phosphoribosyl-ATP diphosphatase [Bosea sp. (in: a-proteobacteria)]